MGLGLLCDHAKRLDVAHGEVGQDLAVDGDLSLGQAVDQAAVRQTELTGGSIDTNDPQGAELTLVLLAPDVGVLATLDDGLGGYAEDLATGVVIALCTADDFLMTTTGGNATLNTSHGSTLP